MLPGAEPFATAGTAVAHDMLRFASATGAGRLVGFGQMPSVTGRMTIASRCPSTPLRLRRMHDIMLQNSAVSNLSRRPRRRTPLSSEARQDMVAVAKEELRAACHAPAADSTLFDGCTVAIVKVAPIQSCLHTA